MIEQVLRKEIEPRGLVIGYEMNLVAMIGQSFAKLGGNYTAAAKGGVTNYADLHQYDVSLRGYGNETTTCSLLRSGMLVIVSLPQV